MAKDIVLENLNEFIEWAYKQSSDRNHRFKLDTRNSYDHEAKEYGTTYLLEVCGTGGGYRGNNYVYIPSEIGLPLSLEWKQNEGGYRFVGMWGIKKILKTLAGPDKVKDYEKAREAVEAQRERQRNHNRADYALSRIAHIRSELDQLNDTLDDLDMHSANLSIPLLEDTELRLMGFVEDSK